jgi:hypothetical protein
MQELKCQGAAFLCVLGLVASANAQGIKTSAEERPSRIVNKPYGFSVPFPKRWFVYEGGDLPAFFNYSADKASPQGEPPPGGADIALKVCDRKRAKSGADPVSYCVEREARAHRGATIERKEIRGLVKVEPSNVTKLSFDEPGLGKVDHTPLSTLHFIVVLWDFRGNVFEAELSYVKDDPKAARYEETLIEIVRGFRPT